MNDLKIFTKTIEQTAKDQINTLLSLDAFKDCKVRIMPDVHAGKGCVIGFTGNLGEKVIPNIVGVDIGCGMFCANLGKIDIDYKKLDEFISNNIPSGMNVYDEPIVNFDITNLCYFNELKNHQRLINSIGTLGGGNHFIELDIDEEGNKYLIVHSGSRNLGTQVADYYQDLANQLCNHDLSGYIAKRDEILTTYKELGRAQEIQSALITLKQEFEMNRNKIPYDFAYLEGEYREKYLNDMKICQKYAVVNRYTIAKRIADYMNWNLDDYLGSIHNYISFEDNIVRKGAISAKENERVIIPINMRDGCILGIGKGNDDWNNSAPHGAGRIMSRAEAVQTIELEDYKKSMEGIYTSSVVKETIDEAPFAYKPIEEIVENIKDTVSITRIIKPVYNFKANDMLPL